ncbi:aldo/keto reductase [Occallatibacter riparius]|uniref:Aldo/keto reductase n=1 Tax=Occallatibacter riparius TaxID=1002689 RepID=A0A9J7BXS8_9BACT|nr:aldo/keto reductase [Occallatibacter riparius]UWZ86786.1 aldo/keto reductase [Occallatibacter riparius]
MERRLFIKQAAMTAAAASAASSMHASNKTPSQPIAKRALGKTGEKLSMIGFGGIVVMNETEGASSNIVAEAVDRGINYFDVAPSYGNAQERLGPALAPYRKNVFLACKTEGRTKDESRKQLEESLRLLKTDHVDLYQFHALTKMKELDQVLGPGGAMETMEAAKREGKIRFIGFSVHSAETAVAALERYPFDTILFPVNWVLFSQASFGPQILKKAQEKGVGILALKAMAKTMWPEGQKKDHPEPKCWYQPAAFPDEASLGLRWTLGHPITAAIPPGDEKYFRLAMDVAQHYKPLEAHEEQALLSGGKGLEPIFKLGNDV